MIGFLMAVVYCRAFTFLVADCCVSVVNLSATAVVRHLQVADNRTAVKCISVVECRCRLSMTICIESAVFCLLFEISYVHVPIQMFTCYLSAMHTL